MAATQQSPDQARLSIYTPTVTTPSITQAGWSVYCAKRAILKSDEIDHTTERIKIPLPEMIFGNNHVIIRHDASGWEIGFNAVDALDRVDKHGNPDGGLVKVSYSEAWLKDKAKSEDGVHEVVKPFDWTYTTDYRGTCGPKTTAFEKTDDRIPLHKLRRPDPILFFEDIVLFEDELGDNGISMLSVKIRVMPDRLLLLCRFFLRVDDVVFRIRDSRVFIEFGDNEVLREYVVKQDTYANVKRKVPFTTRDFGLFLRDQNWVAEQLPVIEAVTEKAKLPVHASSDVR
ncbi:TIP41-like family-domain-containing protein [Lipomyces tetrasporus]|uniref:TIP41-like family-domain-containing protein n=1 Tax=Lipomyces tetrasporus TaxID=54092 RepID=A0AAD7QXC6_9ASCO|nr:TIP41-like family-domain-containing protein [Lipomyces tetrasporus]KAJ8103227.1 TIP41-like family-domain-containing protein [Lipomyces tetrasporus]